MPRPVLTTLSQVIEINDVKDIVVTEIVPDGDGGWIRSIRIMGESDGANDVIALEVKVRTTVQKTDINVTTPELNF